MATIISCLTRRRCKTLHWLWSNKRNLLVNIFDSQLPITNKFQKNSSQMANATTEHSKVQHVLLTGPPGIGKTTLIKKIHEMLRKHEKGITLKGFYTEEIKLGVARIGFDVVTLNGTRGVLARLTDSSSEIRKLPCVGRYTFQPKPFEKIVMPILQTPTQGPHILIIDEIGKMELYSKNFERAVDLAFKTPNLVILATIPLDKPKNIPFITKLKENPSTKIIPIDKGNRDSVHEQVIEMLTNAVKNLITTTST